jgi:hypothetical protein
MHTLTNMYITNFMLKLSTESYLEWMEEYQKTNIKLSDKKEWK